MNVNYVLGIDLILPLMLLNVFSIDTIGLLLVLLLLMP